jgi:hypothetical protein
VSAESRQENNLQANEEPGRQAGLLSLWAGVLLGPMAFLLNLQVNYTLTQELCPGGRTSILHVVTIIFLLLSAAGGLIAWLNWRGAGQTVQDESADKRTRNRFMAMVGLMISALSFLIIVAQWIPQFIFNPCMR